MNRGDLEWLIACDLEDMPDMCMGMHPMQAAVVWVESGALRKTRVVSERGVLRMWRRAGIVDAYCAALARKYKIHPKRVRPADGRAFTDGLMSVQYLAEVTASPHKWDEP